MCGEVKNGNKRNCNSKRWLIPWDEDEGEGVLPWRSGESGDGVGELAGFGYISLKRMWFMRGIRLLPILPISTARHNDALLLRCSDAVVGRSMPRSGVECTTTS